MTFRETEILFVCTGNTCRSPMAEAIWRSMGGRASSAGVSAWSGQRAALLAEEVVARYGASLTGHQARDLEDVRRTPDWILTMTESQRERVIERRPEWAGRTFLLTEMVGESGDITDPIGMDRSVYASVAERLSRLLVLLKEKLSDEVGPHS